MPPTRTIRLASPTPPPVTEAMITSEVFVVSPRGLTVVGDPTFDDWLRFGERLRGLGQALSWAVGDWLIYGEGRGDWGERYAQALDARVMTYESLRVAAHVSGRFPAAARHMNLSWSHHKAVAKFPPDIAERMLVMAETHNWSVAQLREQAQRVSHEERIAFMEFPAGTYGLIYADVPWHYRDGATDPTRVVENQYPTMTQEELLALAPRIAAISAHDCVLMFWSPSPKIAEACAIIEAWGFDYRTCAVWVKDLMGMGYYFRQRHELLLTAVRGNPPVPEPDVRPDSVIESPRQEHSRKPERVYELLEEMFPRIPRVELFARRARAGWEQFGNEPAIARAAAQVLGTTAASVTMPPYAAGTFGVDPGAPTFIDPATPPPARPRIRRARATTP